MRLMPDPISLGQKALFPLGHAMFNREKAEYKTNTIMGFQIPSWQRGLVWTKTQNLRLIESIWLGLNIGTYTYNRHDAGGSLDNLLVDGQQRMMAIQRYLDDEFKVFGYRWSEITVVDQRTFENAHFNAYVTQTSDEAYLRNYYNLMNFGGTAHKKGQRA